MLPYLRRLRGLALVIAFGLLTSGCVVRPAEPAVSPTPAFPSGKPSVTASSGLPSVAQPTATPTPAPPPFPNITATALVKGHAVALHAADFELTSLQGPPLAGPRVLIDAQTDDLDGDGTEEVFATIGDGLIEGGYGVLDGSPAYSVYYGVFAYDSTQGRWMTLQQQVVAWRRYSGYYPFRMQATFADLTGDGRKEVLLFSGYTGAGQAWGIEILSPEGQRLDSVLNVNGMQIYAVYDNAVVKLVEPGVDGPASLPPGRPLIVVGNPAFKPGEASWHPTRTSLTYYSWNGKRFDTLREELLEGYPAGPTPPTTSGAQ
ncbi:MAG: hypothetical protein ACYC1C_09510 [Chloroflexota bacterium]